MRCAFDTLHEVHNNTQIAEIPQRALQAQTTVFSRLSVFLLVSCVTAYLSVELPFLLSYLIRLIVKKDEDKMRIFLPAVEPSASPPHQPGRSGCAQQPKF